MLVEASLMLSDVGDCNVVPNIEKPSWIRTIAVWIAMTRMMNVSSHDGFIRAWPGSPSQKSRRNIILRRIGSMKPMPPSTVSSMITPVSCTRAALSDSAVSVPRPAAPLRPSMMPMTNEASTFTPMNTPW